MEDNNLDLEQIIDGLLIDIEENECVLLLGPEIFRKDDISLTRYMHNYMQKKYPRCIEHFYEKDGIFLFSQKGAKSDIQRAVKPFYEEQKLGNEIPEEILKMIAEMQFHLVISFNPDDYLSELYYKYGLKHQFTYFEFEGKAVKQVDTPTKEIPLIYNLCGYKNKAASLILDYGDLFKYMKAMFDSPKLPHELMISLKEARTFICLGFDFEKWYSQIFLQLLSEEKGSEIRKYSLNKEISDVNTKSFLFHQFGVSFLEDEQNFLHQLHQKLKEQGNLRELGTELSTKQVQITRHIANAELLKALEALRKETLSEENAQMNIQLLSRFNKLEDDRKKGILEQKEYFLEFNRISFAILELTKLVSI